MFALNNLWKSDFGREKRLRFVNSERCMKMWLLKKTDRCETLFRLQQYAKMCLWNQDVSNSWKCIKCESSLWFLTFDNFTPNLSWIGSLHVIIHKCTQCTELKFSCSYRSKWEKKKNWHIASLLTLRNIFSDRKSG